MWYLIFGIVLAVIGCLITYHFGKSCVRYDEVEINAPMVIFIAFVFMTAGIMVNKGVDIL